MDQDSLPSSGMLAEIFGISVSKIEDSLDAKQIVVFDSILDDITRQEFEKVVLAKINDEPIVDVELSHFVKPKKGKKKIVPDPDPELKIVHEEICRDYSRKFSSMQEKIDISDIDSVTKVLLASKYTIAFRELDSVVTDKSMQMNTDKRNRVMRLLEFARPDRQSDLHMMFSQRLPTDFSMRFVKPGSDTDSFGYDLAEVGTCWINSYDFDDFIQRDNVRRLVKDTDVGACVQIISEKNGVPEIYTRNYIIENKDGIHMLFLDTIEGGDISWSDISEWTDHKKGHELLCQIAASVYAAGKLGLGKIVLGEREAQEFGALMGYAEEKVFDRNKPYRKIGIQNTDGKGPFMYQVDDGKEKRVINIDMIFPPNPAELLSRIDDLIDFIGKNRKRFNDTCRSEEVSMYIHALSGMNDIIYNDHSIKERTRYASRLI